MRKDNWLIPLTVSLVLLLIVMAQIRTERPFFFSTYGLPDAEFDALEWIQDNFSEPFIFVMRPRGWLPNQTIPSFEAPAKFILLPRVLKHDFYEGYLFDLLAGEPSKAISDFPLNDTPSYPNAANRRILLVDGKKTGTFYSPDIIEKRVLRILHETDGWVLYTLKENLASADIAHWNATWHSYVETNTIVPTDVVLNETRFEDWQAHSGQLVQGFPVALIMDNGTNGMWIDKTGLNITTASYPFLLIRAYLDGDGFVAVDLYRDQVRVGTSWGSYTRAATGYVTYVIDIESLTNGEVLTRIAIAFSSESTRVMKVIELIVFR